MIHITNLSKVFKSRQGTITALKDINLHVSKGAVYGIIGLSGAGKSTLIRCLNMLERPTEGEIILDGQNMTTLSGKDLRRARQNIGMIFQHFNLLESRTVSGNIAFPLEIAEWSKEEIDERVKELLPLVGLEDKASAYPAQLSGGQKQRVGIARALATKPAVLLCDEATSALDPQTTVSILGLLKEINEKLDLTIVIITHEMKVIKEICTDVAVIDQSQIIEQGSVESVFIHPQSSIAKEFISSVLPNDLPAQLLRELALHPHAEIVKIHFLGSTASEPVITDLIKQCGVTVNILYGSIDYLRSTMFGTLTLELQGSPDSLADAYEYLHKRNLKVEVIRNGI
ncbi:MAG: methionine ABC transporter ATP-binding protein [Gracilibacter sp. BRH_c7a]|nr:MAG: methionine ABC transporter ATP-binding protein [Gracilibacter sp. BRH_c7a]